MKAAAAPFLRAIYIDLGEYQSWTRSHEGVLVCYLAPHLSNGIEAASKISKDVVLTMSVRLLQGGKDEHLITVSMNMSTTRAQVESDIKTLTTRKRQDLAAAVKKGDLNMRDYSHMLSNLGGWERQMGFLMTWFL